MPKRILLVPIVLLLCIGCSKEDEPRYTEEELAQIPQPVREGLPRPSGGFVLAVGEDTITAEDITAALLPRLGAAAQQMGYDEFVEQAMPVVAMTLRDKVADILLYQQAKDAAPEQVDDQLDKLVEKEMRKFIIGFGGDYAKAETFLRDHYGMDWKEFRKYQRRVILSGSYLHGQLAEEKPVTYSEIRKHYEENKDTLYGTEPTITIRLIDIDLASVTADPNTSKVAEVGKRVTEIMDKLNSGEDFATLAMQYSHGYRAPAGGLWKPVKPESLAEPYDILAEQAENMNIGDVSGPIEAKGHIFIMKLEDKKTGRVIPFEEVQGQIAQRIAMERKRKGFDEVMNKVMEEAAIGGLDAFAMHCIEQIYTRANSSGLN